MSPGLLSVHHLQLVKVNIYITDFAFFNELNGVYAEVRGSGRLGMIGRWGELTVELARR